MLNFKSYKEALNLQKDLLTHFPVGTPIQSLRAFAKEQALSYAGEAASGLFPNQIAETDIDFDYRVTCTAQAPDEKWPRSWFSFSNNWMWLMYFYFKNDCLVDIEVKIASNGL